LVDTFYSENTGFSKGNVRKKKVYTSLTYKHACFNNDNLYFITYNNTTFISGFTKLNEKVTQDTFNNINFNINENSFFKFL
jgi:hypothetical protein